MSLSLALSIAGTGLAASAQRANVTSANVANASTSGYVRRSVHATEIQSSGAGYGVAVSDPVRNDRPGLERALRAAATQEAGARVRTEALAAVVDILGKPGSTEGIAGAVSALRDGLERLSVSPERPELLNQAGRAAAHLAAAFRNTASDLAGEKMAAQAALAGDVARANELLYALQATDRSILAAPDTEHPATPAPLLDERGRLLKELATFLPVRAGERDSGALVVMTREGVTLLDGRVAELEVTAPAGLNVDGQSLEPGSGPQAPSGGRLVERLHWLRTELPSIETRVDALAADLIGRADAAGMVNLFADPSGAPGAGSAGRLQVDARVDPDAGGEAWRLRDGLNAPVSGNVGDDRQILDLLAAMDAPTVGPDGSPRSLQDSADFLSLQSQLDSRSAEAEATRLQGFREVIAAELDTAQGVNLDAELQALIEIEKAYAANAMVLETVARMTDALLAIGR